MMLEPVAMATSFLFDCIPLCYIKPLHALTHKQVHSHNYCTCLTIRDYFGENIFGPHGGGQSFGQGDERVCLSSVTLGGDNGCRSSLKSRESCSDVGYYSAATLNSPDMVSEKKIPTLCGSP